MDRVRCTRESEKTTFASPETGKRDRLNNYAWQQKVLLFCDDWNEKYKFTKMA